MGISGLHTYLQSYGKYQNFSCHDPDTKSIVVDGPALAYNVWRQERLKEGDYRSFGKAIERFFMILTEIAGFQVKAIYFDGLLPAHKRAIRLKRSEANLERVKRNRGSLVHSTPPPPFVVPLAQDILRRLGFPVSVVLEEADTACARRTLEESNNSTCYLLSLDSDFHCFDLGTNGFYLPLDALSCSELSVTGCAYNFLQTQEALGINLVQLATMMGAEGSEDAPRSAGEAVKILKRSNIEVFITQSEIARVERQFCTLPRTTQVDALSAQQKVLLDQGRIYGRFAELLTSGECWLPQLLEDYTQTSAWNIGLRYRAQAYKLLIPAEVLPTRKTRVSEWMRRAQCISGRDVNVSEFDPISIDQPVTVKSVFVECMKTLIQMCSWEKQGLSQHEYHAFIVMILGTYQSGGEEMSKRLLHLTARYQATIYSIIMLIQAQGISSWPEFSKLYDLQTFSTALKLLQAGKRLEDLTRGHETEVIDLLGCIGWQSERALKKAKRVERRIR